MGSLYRSKKESDDPCERDQNQLLYSTFSQVRTAKPSANSISSNETPKSSRSCGVVLLQVSMDYRLHFISLTRKILTSF